MVHVLWCRCVCVDLDARDGWFMYKVYTLLVYVGAC